MAGCRTFQHSPEAEEGLAPGFGHHPASRPLSKSADFTVLHEIDDLSWTGETITSIVILSINSRTFMSEMPHAYALKP